MQRKRPEGALWLEFLRKWKEGSHDEKVKLCEMFGVSYGSGKHWVSDYKEGAKEDVKDSLLPLGDNKPVALTLTKPHQVIAIIGDTHNPYEDKKVVALIGKFLAEKVKPDYLIYNGDINDFYQVSDFAKDPKRLGHLQEDLDSTKGMLKWFNDILPETKKILIEGTHEFRWQKFLQKTAPAVSGLECCSIKELYELDSMGIALIPYERGLLINDVFLVLHGDIASKYSAMSARNQFEKNGGNGMCNHTHRGGSFYKRDRFGFWGWWENFCVEPDTLVLKEDLSWVKLNTVKVGDTLLGVDEEAQVKARRKIRKSVVTDLHYTNLPTYCITLSDGRVLKASADHRWLTAHETHKQPYWIKTENLIKGTKLRQIGVPWSTETSYDAGWLAGIFDGEGCLDGCNAKKASLNIRFGQVKGVTLDKTKELLSKFGIEYSIRETRLPDTKYGLKRQEFQTISTTGMSNSLKLLGSIRPNRLLSKVILEGVGLPERNAIVVVESVEPIGNKDLISIETSTHTFFANGLVTHNCVCSLNPDWIQNPNWLHGFSLLHMTNDSHFWVEQVPIIKNKFIYGGDLFE